MAGELHKFPEIQQMEPISLEEMDAVRLMNRIDTKFVTTEDTLHCILAEALSQGYRVCEIDGERLLGYTSMYYDTSDLEMFRIHRAGKKTRQKIRVRTYLISGITFLEIKLKNNKGRTKKKRMKLDSRDIAATEGSAEFIQTWTGYDLADVPQACTTDFQRITLVNKEKTERVTMDTALSFTNPRTGLTAGLGDAVIIELKQDGRLPSSMKRILMEQRVHPAKISKYCIGTVLTSPEVLPGRFKMKVRALEKMTGKKLAAERTETME